MRTGYQVLSYAFLIFFAASSLASGDCAKVLETLPAETRQELEKITEKLRVDGNSPGFAASVFSSSKILWSAGVGSMRSSEQIPVDPKKTLFPIASVSKTFTAMAVLQLVKENKFGLNTPLSQLEKTRFIKLAERNSPEMLSDLDQITVSNLLNHTSGMNRDLKGVDWFNSSSIEDNQYPSAQDFEEGFGSLTFDYRPGNLPASILYGNMNYNLLAQIVEAYGGSSSFSEYMQEHVFKPLGISHATYGIDADALSILVTSYGKTHEVDGLTIQTEMPPVIHPGSYAGSVGVNISAEGLAVFGQNLLQLTSYRGRSQLKINRFDALTPTVLDTFEGFAFGHGLILQTVKPDKDSDEEFLFYGHTGTIFGSKAMIYVSPELDIGFVALANSRDAKTSSALGEYLRALIDDGVISKDEVVLSKEVQRWIGRTKSFIRDFSQPEFFIPASTQQLIRFDTYETSDFTGTYYSDVDGILDVSISEVTQRLEFLGAELMPYKNKKDFFHVNGMSWFGHAGGVIEFERDTNGEVIGINAFNGEIILERKK